jgi:hypothetical protein
MEKETEMIYFKFTNTKFELSIVEPQKILDWKILNLTFTWTLKSNKKDLILKKK